MQILSTDEMSNIDKRTIREYGISGETLMENAGKAVVAKMEKYFGGMSGKKVLIACGKGNNGGDGYVIARHLINKGARVYVLLCATRQEIHGDAKTMFERLPDETVFVSFDEIEDIHFEIGVDAIFGTGFNGRIDDVIAMTIDKINRCAVNLVAVDIPSGVNGNTGAISNTCIHADYTFTFCREKLAHRLYPGRGVCGKVEVCDIGIPEQAVLDEEPKIELFTKYNMDNLLRPLSPLDHKGVNGKLLIIGGSTGMAGAVCLSAMAALRAGVGLCNVAIPQSVYPIVAGKLTEAMTIPLPDNADGCISQEAVDRLLDVLSKVDGVVVGCGMSTNEDTCKFLYRLLPEIHVPVLIDADGLNIISKNMDCLYSCNGRITVTPHMMEMSRLAKVPLKKVEGDRVGTAMEFAWDKRVTVVLKGDGTVTTGGTTAYINTSGNPGMATAGSGDVLSGVIGAFLAAGMKPMKAGACGAFIHGMAGDYAADKLSMRGMIASDIVNALPYCFTVALPSRGASSLLEKHLTGKEIGYTHRMK